MSADLILKPACSCCGSTTDLYGSNCKHLTICISCGKTMAENRTKCYECGATITRLIREYSVRASSSSDKKYFIGRFVSGLPSFSKKREADKWSIQKEGLQGCQLSDALREKYKNKPWLLEDESGQFQYRGVLEGAQSAAYYLLMLQGKEFVAILAGSWYNFNKVPQFKQLTLEEAEEKMKNRRKTADGYERWMMKAANNGAAAFGEVEKFDDKENGVSGGRGHKKLTSGGDDDEANTSDKGEEDDEEESARKNRLGLNKKGGGGGDEEGPRRGDFDFVADDIEKGDDWEHVEIFTDDDEAVGNDLEEWEDLAAEIPAPLEIKQDDEDEEEGDGKGGGLSNSGKELKKLLGRTTGLNESDEEDDYDEEDDDGFGASPVLVPKQKDAPKEEPGYYSPLTLGSGHSSPSISKSARGKRRKTGDDTKSTAGAPSNIVKTENEVNPVKEETAATLRSGVPARGPSSAPPESGSSLAAGLVREDEVRAVLLQNIQMTTQDLVAIFKPRLKSKEDKLTFADLLKRISKMNTTKDQGPGYVVLRKKRCT